MYKYKYFKYKNKYTNIKYNKNGGYIDENPIIDFLLLNVFPLSNTINKIFDEYFTSLNFDVKCFRSDNTEENINDSKLDLYHMSLDGVRMNVFQVDDFKIDNVCFFKKNDSIYSFYKDSLKIPCFMASCYTSNLLFSKDDMLISAFQFGKIDDIEIILQKIKTDFILFKNYLDIIVKIICEKKINKLVLTGHSYGMSSATLISFILLYIQQIIIKTTIETNCISLFRSFTKYDLFDLLDSLTVDECFKNIEVYVYGTAGYPLMFITRSEFNFYLMAIQNRYLHFGTAINQHKYDINLEPEYMSNIYKKNYGIYLLCYVEKSLFTDICDIPIIYTPIIVFFKSILEIEYDTISVIYINTVYYSNNIRLYNKLSELYSILELSSDINVFINNQTKVIMAIIYTIIQLFTNDSRLQESVKQKLKKYLFKTEDSFMQFKMLYENITTIDTQLIIYLMKNIYKDIFITTYYENGDITGKQIPDGILMENEKLEHYNNRYKFLSNLTHFLDNIMIEIYHKYSFYHKLILHKYFSKSKKIEKNKKIIEPIKIDKNIYNDDPIKFSEITILTEVYKYIVLDQLPLTLKQILDLINVDLLYVLNQINEYDTFKKHFIGIFISESFNILNQTVKTILTVKKIIINHILIQLLLNIIYTILIKLNFNQTELELVLDEYKNLLNYESSSFGYQMLS